MKQRRGEVEVRRCCRRRELAGHDIDPDDPDGAGQMDVELREHRFDWRDQRKGKAVAET